MGRGLFAVQRWPKTDRNSAGLTADTRSACPQSRAKHDPLAGSTQAKVRCGKGRYRGQTPNLGIRKAVKISLIKNGNKLTAFAIRRCHQFH